MENNHVCEPCGGTFANSSNLRAHARKFHPGIVQDIAPKKQYNIAATCEECSKTFSLYCNFMKHVRKYHSEQAAKLIVKKSKENPSTASKFKCKKCNNIFFNFGELKTHKRVHHNIDSDQHHSKKKCPLCTYTNSSKDVINHFELRHNIQMSLKNLSFSTFEEFTAWKNELEKTTRAKFVKSCSTRFNLNNKDKRFIFECHRSGIYRPKGKGLRRLKKQGTCKINGFCPAGIRAKVLENGECKVVWNTTHVGHDYDLGHITLTFNERMQIASKIAAKTPYSVILDDIRDSVSNCDRLHLLTKRDLYNIECSFNLNSHSMRHKNDALSVENSKNEINVTSSPIIDESRNEKKEEELMITRAVSCNSRQVDSEEKFKKKIESLNLTFMQASAGIASMEEYEAVKKIMNSIEPTLIAIRNQSNNKNKLLPSKITSNKNNAPQRKKKKNTNKINKELSFAKPTSTQMDGLDLNLLHSDVVADSNISNFEEVGLSWSDINCNFF